MPRREHQNLILYMSLGIAAFIAGCETTPSSEKGPEHTKTFYVQVQASVEGVRIETNNAFAGNAPLTLRILGNKDGTFHNFGNPQFVFRALPLTTNGLAPVQVFKAGTSSSPGDRIPGLIFFDMARPTGSFSVDSAAEN